MIGSEQPIAAGGDRQKKAIDRYQPVVPDGARSSLACICLSARCIGYAAFRRIRPRRVQLGALEWSLLLAATLSQW